MPVQVAALIQLTFVHAVKLAFTHPQLVVVQQVLSLLDREGIACTLRNEYAAGAVGELAPLDAWPELWIQNDSDYDRANQVLEVFTAEVEEPEWPCDQCGKSSPATFEFCWHCGWER